MYSSLAINYDNYWQVSMLVIVNKNLYLYIKHTIIDKQSDKTAENVWQCMCVLITIEYWNKRSAIVYMRYTSWVTDQSCPGGMQFPWQPWPQTLIIIMIMCSCSIIIVLGDANFPFEESSVIISGQNNFWTKLKTFSVLPTKLIVFARSFATINCKKLYHHLALLVRLNSLMEWHVHVPIAIG